MPSLKLEESTDESNKEFSTMREMLQQFWEDNGNAFEVCKFQKNPFKNKIFNKEEGVDLVKDHLLFHHTREIEGVAMRVELFAKSESEAESCERRLLGRIQAFKRESEQAEMLPVWLYEGEVFEMLP
mmetsp:Transcript_964/g.1721  ORF Transcript_964/g.1721 Transcript_964/m.1721 type:complete len:127 (+) Transcript_964:74-454(+)